MAARGAAPAQSVILLVAWGKSPAKRWVRPLEAAGFAVAVEDHDGARAYRWARTNQPAAVLIDGSTLPSHGRATAGAILQAPATRHLPVICTNIAARDWDQMTAAAEGALALLSAPTDERDVMALLTSLVSTDDPPSSPPEHSAGIGGSRAAQSAMIPG